MSRRYFNSSWTILSAIILGTLLLGNGDFFTGISHCSISPSVDYQVSSNSNIDEVKADSAILIETDEQFNRIASERHWPGTGTVSNPYIISDLIFPQGKIFISNTNVYFLIVNNTFHNPNDGIILRNVANAIIYNNSITNAYGNAIIVDSCLGISIIGNSINNSNQHSISIVDTYNFTIESNIIHYSGHGGQNDAVKLNYAENGKILENVLVENYGIGFSLDSCTDILLSFNQITSTGLEGIRIENSESCSILSNRVILANSFGVSLENVSMSTISNNLVQSSVLTGLRFASTTNCSISKNHLWGCDTGIDILSNSNFLQIFDNKIEGSSTNGLQIINSNDCLLTSNIVINNDEYGISLENCENNSVRWNDFVNNNGLGIQGLSNDNIGIPHIIEHNYWGNNASSYLLEGNAGTNDSIPQLDYCQLFSNLDLFSFSEDFGLFLSLQWNINDNNNWNLTYTISISPNAGKDWIEVVSGINNQSYSCNFTNLLASYQYLIKISARSEEGILKVVYSDKFVYYEGVSGLTITSPTNNESLRKNSIISWKATFPLHIRDLFYSIFISENNISWHLVQAWVFGETVNWNTSEYSDGTYYLKIITHNFHNLKWENYFNGTFEIDNHYLNPEPVLISPIEGEILSGNVFLSWIESFDFKGFPVTYNVFYSSIEGWEPIVMNLSSSSYTWDTTTVKDGSNYRLRIEARGGLDEYIRYETTFSFTIENVTAPPLETTIIFVLVLAIIGLISVVYLLRKRLTAAELALKVKELKVGFCLGTFTDKGLIIRQKNEDCPYDNLSLLSGLEYGAVLVQRSKYEIIYGPFPHPPDQDGNEWYNVVYGFKIHDSQVVDSRIVQQQGETPALLLVYYPRQFDVLFMLQKQKIEDYLGKTLNELDIDDLILRGFDIIHEKVRQILLDYKPIEMDLVLEE